MRAQLSAFGKLASQFKIHEGVNPTIAAYIIPQFTIKIAVSTEIAAENTPFKLRHFLYIIDIINADSERQRAP